MTGTPWMKFYTADWRADPRLKMCSAGARGVWIEMICLMHEAMPYGHLLVHGQTPNEAQLASLTGIPVAELSEYLAELERMGVFSRTREGVVYSRKLVRMGAKSAKARKIGKTGGNPSLSKQTENHLSLNLQDNGDHKPQIPDTRTQIDKNARARASSEDKDFEAWWQEYPHKIGKAAAHKAFRAARKSADLETLVDGVRRYIRQKPADRNWCNPSTWLNQQRWLDAPAEASSPPSHQPALPKAEALKLTNGKLVPRRTALERCTKFFQKFSETGRRSWSPISAWFDDKPPDDPDTVYPPEIIAEARKIAGANRHAERDDRTPLAGCLHASPG